MWKNYKLIGITLICISLLMLIGTAQAAYEDSFRNHPSDVLSQKNENNLSWTVTYNSIYAPKIDPYPLQYKDVYNIYLEVAGASKYSCIKTNEPTLMPYISFNLTYFSQTGSNAQVVFTFYNSTNQTIGETLSLHTVISEGHHYEIVQTKPNLILYEDGNVLKDLTTWDVGTPDYSQDIYYFKLYVQSATLGAGTNFFFTDFVTGTGEDNVNAIVSCMPQNWYIRRDLNDESLTGQYDGGHNLINPYFMNATYSWRNALGRGVANNIKMYHMSTNTYMGSVDVYTSSTDIITYNVSNLLMNENYLSDLFGNYVLMMYRGADMIAYDIFKYRYITSGIFTGTVDFENDKYVASELVKITTTLTDEDFNKYNFEIGVTNIYGVSEYVESITTDSEVDYWDTTGVSADYYYVQLWAINKTTGFKFVLDDDKCYISQKVAISGTTYNAYNGSILADVDVKYIQGLDYYNATSDVLGDYNIGEIDIEISTVINASKVDYVHNNFTLTFLSTGIQDMDLWLLPDASNLPHSGTTIAGLAQKYPFHQSVSGATINIWNSTWSNSTTTTSSGYYYFENLANGTYWMNASVGWHEITDDEQVVTNDGTVKYQYFLLNPLYTLTVSAKNANTLLTVIGFNVVLDNGDKMNTTTNGVCEVDNVGWGIHKLEVSSEGYYGTIEYVNVFGDTSYTSYLTPISEETGAGVYYSYHYVTFLVKRCSWWVVFCKPESGVSIVAVPLTGNATNTSLSGITDSDGAVVFKMTQDIKYQVKFIKDSWNDELNIYPKYDEYKVYISGGVEVDFDKNVEWEFSNNEIDDNDIYLNFSYNDGSLKTHTLTFEVYKAVKSDLWIYNASNRTELYNLTVVDTNAYNFSYTASNWHNNTFVLKFNSTYSDDYSPKSEVKVYKFKPLDKPLLDLQFEDSRWYFILSVGILFFIGGLFSAVSVPTGGVVVAGSALLLNYFGWLTYNNDTVILLSVFILAVLIYIRRRGKEEGVV